MKKSLIAIALMLSIPAVALAGFGMGPGHGRHGGNPEMMARMLDLTPEQQDKMQALWAEQARKRDEMRSAMQAEIQTKLQSILSKEQYAKMQDLRSYRQAQRGQGVPASGMRGAGMRGGQGPCAAQGNVVPPAR